VNKRNFRGTRRQTGKKKRNQEKKAQKRQKDKRAKGKRPKDKASSSPQIRVCVCGVPQKSPTQVGIGCIVCRWCESSYHRRYNMYERYRIVLGLSALATILYLRSACQVIVSTCLTAQYFGKITPALLCARNRGVVCRLSVCHLLVVGSCNNRPTRPVLYATGASHHRQG
jgi:hypothetical protein